MTLKLKKFERTGSIITKEPTVSFTAKGLRFNVASTAKYIKDAKGVELFFDDDAKVVGFQFFNKITKDSFKVNTYRQGKSPLTAVSCTQFIESNKIHSIIGNTKQFLLEEYEGMLIAKLGGAE